MRRESLSGLKNILESSISEPKPTKNAANEQEKRMITERKCPAAKKCSGCQLSNMTYEQQLEWKQKDVEKLLGKFGKVNKVIPMENPYNYRNKVQAVFRSDRSGRIISGVYQSSRNGVVGVDSCMLNDPTADKIILGIRELMRSFKLMPYDEGTGRGFLKHVLVRVGKKSGEVLVTIVGGSPMFPKKRDFVNALVKRFPEITTVTFSVNKTDDMMVLGEKNETLFGDGYITDELCGKRFRISPRSFYQVNPTMTEKMYAYAISAAALNKKETLLDAYSGIGTIGIIASDYAGQVQGIEYNASAVRDAVRNCQENGLTRNIAFNKGDAGEYLREKAKIGTRFDAVIMDPARAGADRMFLNALVKIAPKRIVYISCSPAALARDLKTLEKKYTVADIQPFDMFPHTRHVETVVLLSKLKSTHHIEVELKTDELDLTSAESKATYDEIKAYVKKHTGLTVSSLNIAQVKQKCGIIERENYNKAKSKDSRQPKRTKEKEEAIVDSLKYFKMI